MKLTKSKLKEIFKKPKQSNTKRMIGKNITN